MKKKFVTILCAMCFVLAFTACSNNSTPASSEPETEEDETTSSSEDDATSEPESEEEPEAEVETSTPAGNEELGDSLAEPIMVQLDGAVYSFPGSTFTDFEANGWVIDPGAEGSTLAANYSTSIEYTKGEATIKLSAANNGDSAIPINECECWALVYQGGTSGTIDFAFPGGIVKGSVSEEVEAAYGEPTDFYDSDGVRKSMEYKLDNGKVKFQFYGEENTLSDFEIRS